MLWEEDIEYSRVDVVRLGCGIENLPPRIAVVITRLGGKRGPSIVNSGLEYEANRICSQGAESCRPQWNVLNAPNQDPGYSLWRLGPTGTRSADFCPDKFPC
jgi:hypothetical protein